MRRRRFPLLEILIVFAVVALLYIIIYPQYQETEEANKEMATKVSMYAVKVAVENFSAYNGGVFPDSVSQFSPYLESGYVNPYTERPIDPSQIVLFAYKNHGDNKDDSPEGPNGRMNGQPGMVGYGIFKEGLPSEDKAAGDSAVADSVVKEYGIIGFAKDNYPITIVDPAGKELIFIVHD